jgi:hypothetical protein
MPVVNSKPLFLNMEAAVCLENGLMKGLSLWFYSFMNSLFVD